jgi:Na+/H+-dicarboxylate symporter
VVAVTATLAAIGAAAIPSAGLVTMLMVLQVGIANHVPSVVAQALNSLL